MKRAILLVTGFLAVAVVGTLAQGGATGAIVGKVQDTSGAIVASAEIRIVNQSTGVLVRTPTSDDRGSFSAFLFSTTKAHASAAVCRRTLRELDLDIRALRQPELIDADDSRPHWGRHGETHAAIERRTYSGRRG